MSFNGEDLVVAAGLEITTAGITGLLTMAFDLALERMQKEHSMILDDTLKNQIKIFGHRAISEIVEALVNSMKEAAASNG